MAILTVTARGQVTFRRKVIQHLGIKSGDKIELEFLPDGRAEWRAAKPVGGWQDLSGGLKDKGIGAVLSIDELNEAIAERGAEAGLEVLEAGSDFAEGAIAYEERWLSGETFVSFDAKAVKLLARQGRPALMPA